METFSFAGAPQMMQSVEISWRFSLIDDFEHFNLTGEFIPQSSQFACMSLSTLRRFRDDDIVFYPHSVAPGR